MRKFRYGCSLLLCFVLLFSSIGSVYAETGVLDNITSISEGLEGENGTDLEDGSDLEPDGLIDGLYSTEAIIDAEGLLFDIVIPTKLPISVDNTGSVTVADNCVIENNSGGKVYVSNVSVSAENSWELVDFTTDFSKEKVNLKEFGMVLNSNVVNTDGSVLLGDSWESIDAYGDTLDLVYDANIAYQSQEVREVIASVEFTVDWEKGSGYLTLSSDTDYSLSTVSGSENWNGELYYSVDTMNWVLWTGDAIYSDNSVLYLRGENNTKISGSTSEDYKFVFDGATNLVVDGNIETLLDWETVVSGGHPTVGNSAFAYLFYGCTELVKAPSLLSTTLAGNCYQAMFGYCTNLEVAPNLPALEVSEKGYSNMFVGCTSLVYAPVISAEVMGSSSCMNMFDGCTSLKYVYDLTAMQLTSNCYKYMFKGCTSLEVAPALPALTMASYAYNGMFYNCSSLRVAPAMPATVLNSNCYQAMFSNCKSLQISDTWSEEYCYEWALPYEGEISNSPSSWNLNMISNTGGEYTSDPSKNTVYYTVYEPTVCYVN